MRLSDELRFVKFSSIAWTHDSNGFFYQRFPDRSRNSLAGLDKVGLEVGGDKDAQIFYHRIGTNQ